MLYLSLTFIVTSCILVTILIRNNIILNEINVNEAIMSYGISEGPVSVTSICLRPIKVSISLENFTMDTFENTDNTNC